MFSVEPAKDGVTFPNGSAIEGEDGWFLDSASKIKVKYDEDSGKILLQTTSSSTNKAIKVEIKFAGQTQTVKKTISIVKK